MGNWQVFMMPIIVLPQPIFATFIKSGWETFMNGPESIATSISSRVIFIFAAAAHLPKLMNEFEEGILLKYTPCHFESMEKIIKDLAIVHTELVLIHPFREGNGRVARMLATLMTLQAGLPPLDFSGIVGNRKKDYIQAIHAGIEHNYLPMERILMLLFVGHFGFADTDSFKFLL